MRYLFLISILISSVGMAENRRVHPPVRVPHSPQIHYVPNRVPPAVHHHIPQHIHVHARSYVIQPNIRIQWNQGYSYAGSLNGNFIAGSHIGYHQHRHIFVYCPYPVYYPQYYRPQYVVTGQAYLYVLIGYDTFGNPVYGYAWVPLVQLIWVRV